MTGKILVAATAKGGAGKSTTVACLAAYWHQAGRRVALLDADPNRTLTRWHAKGDVLSRMTLRTEVDEHAIVPAVAALQEAHDVVLVDCAGFNNQAMLFAIAVADLVLIPVMTDEANVFEALRAHKIVESASRVARRAIPARTMLARTKRAAVADHTRAQLESLDAKPLVSSLADRAIFQEATFHGSAPTHLDPASAAAREVAALAREVEELLWPAPADVPPEPAPAPPVGSGAEERSDAAN